MPGLISKKQSGLLYAFFYGGQFVLLGMQLPFLAGWLSTKSFTASEIGLITGAALIARLLFGPAVAFWADHQHDERRALRWVSFLFAAGAVLLSIGPNKFVIALAALTVLWTFGLLVPLSDSAVLRADRNGYLNYGRTRAAGSAFFLATTILGGVAVSQFGLSVSVFVMAAAAAAAFGVSLLLPPGAGDRGGVTPVSWREAPRFLTNPVFVLIILSAGLTQGAHAVYYAFSYLRWDAIGYSAQTIGFLWATGVVAEIFLLTRARGLAARISPTTLLAIGGGAAMVRWAMTAIEPALWVLFVIQTLHALTFAAAYLGSIEFLDRAAPKRLVNTGMTLMSTTGVGAITGAATVIAGFIWEGAGPAAAYYMMAAMGAGALITALFVSRKWDGGKIFD